MAQQYSQAYKGMCGCCGKVDNHSTKNCRHLEKQCDICGDFGHLKEMCGKPGMNRGGGKKRNKAEVKSGGGKAGGPKGGGNSRNAGNSGIRGRWRIRFAGTTDHG